MIASIMKLFIYGYLAAGAATAAIVNGKPMNDSQQGWFLLIHALLILWILVASILTHFQPEKELFGTKSTVWIIGCPMTYACGYGLVVFFKNSEYFR